MIIFLLFLFIYEIISQEGATPFNELVHVDDLPNVGMFRDAEHRGPAWYNDELSGHSKNSDSDAYGKSKSSSLSEESDSISPSRSSDASSLETQENVMGTRVYRTCTPCPHDMLKKRTNIGIKWICGGYQRARRSFKSTCMMRYRNCEDGTMFVKLFDHRCKNDTYHGKHWFYVYRV